MSRALQILVALMLILIGSSGFVAGRWPNSDIAGHVLSAPKPCPDRVA